MNNLSTAKPSQLQNRWRSLPWGTVLFIAAVFVYATPIINFNLATINATDAVDAVTQKLSGGNIGRQIALIALGAFALVGLLRRKEKRFQINGILGWLILFYLGWAVLSIMWSIDPRFTIKRVGILVMLSVGALYVADRFSLQETIALVYFINAIYFFSAVFLLIKTGYFQPLNPSWRFGFNVHPITQGWQLGLLILASFALAKTAEKKRVVYYGIALIAFFFLVLTRSRGPLLGFMAGFTVFLGLVAPMRYQVAFFLGIVIIGCLLVFLPDDVLNTYGVNIITVGRGEEGLGSMTTLSGRIPLWRECLSSALERPLLGHGYNSFFAPINIAPFNKKIGWIAATPHSGYIGTVLGLGYTGVVVFVLILFLAIKMSVRLGMRDSDYAFMAAVLVWLCVCLYAEEDLLTRPYFPCFVWMIVLAKLGFLAENRARDT
jgi:O-antigen ligase